MLELRAVSTSAGREAVLTRVDAGFPAQAVTSVLGLSAAGRSRLAGVLSGADAIREGQILIDGAPLGGKVAGRNRGRVILTGPFPGAAGGRRPRDLLLRALREGRKSGGDIQSETEKLAGELGLGGRMDFRLRDLEPEQAGRLMLASVFVARPAVAVFDQALDGFGVQLAADVRERLLRELVQRSAEAGTTTIWLSGLAGDARTIGGHTLVLDSGRVAAMGPTAEVFAHPATLAVARAIAEPALNEIRLAARDGALRLADGSRFEAPGGLALPGEGACTLGFGPEHIAMARGDDDAVRFVVRMNGEEMIGGRAYLRLGFAGETWLAPKPETAAPGVGVTLSVFVDRTRLMAFGADGARIS